MRLMNMLKLVATRAILAVKKFGAFSVGMFLGTCYGSVVGTLTTYFMLMGW